jgi:hypothetical protein
MLGQDTYCLDARCVYPTERPRPYACPNLPLSRGWSELLLALPEFILTGACSDEHDELVAHVELPRDVQACTRCGVLDRHRVHDRRTHTVRHLPVAGPSDTAGVAQAAVGVHRGLRQLRRTDPSVAPGAVWSRAAAGAAVALSETNIPVDTIRRRFGVGWDTVMRAVIAAADQLAAIRPVRVGIDETVMITGRLTTRRRHFLTALVCLDTCLVVAVTQGRDGALAARPLAEYAPNATVVPGLNRM